MGVMFGMTFLTVFSALLAVNVSRDVLVGIEDQFKKNEILSDLFSKEPIEAPAKVRQQADELCLFINELKDELMVNSGNNPDDYQHSNIHNADRTDAVKIVLNTKENPLGELKYKISEFKTTVETSKIASKDLRNLSDAILNIEDRQVGDNPANIVSCEYYHFGSSQLIIALDMLSRIDRNVRFIESELSYSSSI